MPRKAVKATLLVLLRFYRLAVSPLLGPSCRFEPTCSVFATQAIERYGALKGTYLAVKRILRCHPFAQGGLDPVPSASTVSQSHARSS